MNHRVKLGAILVTTLIPLVVLAQVPKSAREATGKSDARKAEAKQVPKNAPAASKTAGVQDDQDKPASLLYALPGSNGRIIIWEFGGKRYAVAQPIVLTVAKSPGTTRPAIGLTHSGYSEEDPDGKNAILTISVVPEKRELTEDERQALEMDGTEFIENMRVADINFSSLDIALPADPQEEARIRSEYKLPKRLGVAGAVVPLSIRWKGVPGATLHHWLTDPDQGLKIVLRGEGNAIDTLPVLWDVKRRYTTDEQVKRAWWAQHAKDRANFRWRGGIGPLAVNLLREGLVNVNGQKADLSDSQPVFEALSTQLRPLVTRDRSGIYTLARDDYMKLGLNTTITVYSIEGAVDALPSLSPGATLTQNPESIKDLSGNGNGLEPLKADQPSR